jgi:hypothetical protein
MPASTGVFGARRRRERLFRQVEVFNHRFFGRAWSTAHSAFEASRALELLVAGSVEGKVVLTNGRFGPAATVTRLINGVRGTYGTNMKFEC